jgi:hypothetical protein
MFTLKADAEFILSVTLILLILIVAAPVMAGNQITNLRSLSESGI